MAKGLLLGAGFSYDLGMPLASEFSDTLFSYFNLEKMTNLINDMKDRRPYGDDKPLSEGTINKILEIVNSFYQSDKSNYERLFADIENMPVTGSDAQQTVHYYLSVMRSIINELFLIYQLETYPCYLVNREKYKWFFDGFTDDELWVLTLNHDILVEMLCIDYDIPLREGYLDIVQIPTSNRELDRCIAFGKISATEKDISNLQYFNSSKGVNLLKIHGGLNEYFQGDDKSGRNRLLFNLNAYKHSNEYLSQIERFAHMPHYYINNKAVRLGSEIAFSDANGMMQFMQPSILTGSKKYSQTLSSKAREEKIELFSTALEKIDELYIIGYSFGDKHINNRIVHAMHLNPQMKVVIVNPTYEEQEIFAPFDYGLRVRYCSMGFSIWADHERTGTWNTKLRNNLETSNSKIRKPILDAIKASILKGS